MTTGIESSEVCHSQYALKECVSPFVTDSVDSSRSGLSVAFSGSGRRLNAGNTSVLFMHFTLLFVNSCGRGITGRALYMLET